MTEQQKKAPPPLVDEQLIADYLQENTDFFVNHPQLLADLNLPHESGDAVSLVERQVSILRERNMDMRRRLGRLLDNARDNTKLFEKTRRLNLMLLEAQHLKDVIDSVFFSFDNDFDIAFTSLILFGDATRIPETQARVVSIHIAREHASRFLSSHKTLCGDLPADEVTFIFADQAPDIASCAVAPLINGNIFGLLAVGSNDPHRYRSSMGTLFLSYISEILSRVIPKHIS